MEGGIRNRAARGALRRGAAGRADLGEADGDIRFHPDESIVV